MRANTMKTQSCRGLPVGNWNLFMLADFAPFPRRVRPRMGTGAAAVRAKIAAAQDYEKIGSQLLRLQDAKGSINAAKTPERHQRLNRFSKPRRIKSSVEFLFFVPPSSVPSLSPRRSRPPRNRFCKSSAPRPRNPRWTI